MKALVHVVPRVGAEEMFESRIREVARELREHPDATGLAVNAMLRLKDDPFGARTPYRASLEITGEPAGASAFEPLVAGVGLRLADVAHVDLSTLLVGEDVVFVASHRAPVRYQYLMRRNASFTHGAYLKRYREIHSQFGLRTPGILGYVQFHVDPEASRRAAGRAGLGVWGVDSVSELHLESVEVFLGEVARSPVGAEAIADEEIFVDRDNSLDFCSTVEWQARSESP
jgi:hypothetical protein